MVGVVDVAKSTASGRMMRPTATFASSVLSMVTELYVETADPEAYLQRLLTPAPDGKVRVLGSESLRATMIGTLGQQLSVTVRKTTSTTTTIKWVMPPIASTGAHAKKKPVFTHREGHALDWSINAFYISLFAVQISNVVQQSNPGGTFWDIGTGSGWLPTLIKLKNPALQIVATDLVGSATALAKLNAENNDIEVDVRQGSMFEPFGEGENADFISFFPPQISTADMEHPVGLNPWTDAEQVALFVPPGEHDSHFFNMFADAVPGRLKPKGFLFLGVDKNHLAFVKERFGKLFELVRVDESNQKAGSLLVVFRNQQKNPMQPEL